MKSANVPPQQVVEMALITIQQSVLNSNSETTFMI